MLFANTNAVRAGLRVGTFAQKSPWGQMRLGAGWLAVGVPLAAFEAANAPKGQKISMLTGQTGGLLMYPALAGVASMGLSVIPGIGPITAVVLGSMLAAYPDNLLGNSLARKVRTFSEFGLRSRHLEMGGSYQDTLLAERQRQIAIQDMNATMIPGRRYLGQEALLMHR